MSGDWAQQLAEELHKPITRKFTKRRVFVKGVDEIWAADLVEMGRFSDWNKGIKYLLMVIDVFSKFGWIEPLKNKKAKLWRLHSKKYSNPVDNRGCYGLIKVKNFIIKM